MGVWRGLWDRLRTFWRRSKSDTGVEQRRSLDLIHAELRRARRYGVPFSVAMFRWERPAGREMLLGIARELQRDLREFDYVVVDEEMFSVSLWLFGTPRQGALTKLDRMRASPVVSNWIFECVIGLASFPDDGLTYEALTEHARSMVLNAADSEGEQRAEWQPIVQGANSPSMF